MSDDLEQVQITPAEHNAWKLHSFLPTTTMELKNMSTKKHAAFKIKTTEPYRYKYHPTSGFIKPGESLTVTINMERAIIDVLVMDYKAKGTAGERAAYLMHDGKSRDKFMVKTMHCDESEFDETNWVTKTLNLREEAEDKKEGDVSLA